MIDIEKCVWCGKTYEQHVDYFYNGIKAKTPCGLLKSGFLPRKKEISKIETRPIHIVPNNDIIPHTTIGDNCWCKPRFENTGVGIYIHNSGDKRELLEIENKQND